jgi:hypothetical protein
MKSLGKQPVTAHSYLDGVLTGSGVITRVVYEDKDGTYWINDLNSKRMIQKTANGFEFNSGVSRLNGMNGKQFFEHLAAKFGVK